MALRLTKVLTNTNNNDLSLLDILTTNNPSKKGVVTLFVSA